MTRKKADRDARLSRLIGLRVSESFYKRLKEWLANSNCRSITELTRSILYREEIVWKHTDASLESTAIELAGIRKELNAIGKNINQITHHFHTTDSAREKFYDVQRIDKEYKQVSAKVERLLTIAGELSKKWLQ
ncbi:MAG: plasmid mobilization relaxosome protein MobC [Cyclobacteriaceae bacterium]|nr:plasmid mobilization relaxosome protein MobC [Cyclobacteriaceae bacterium]